MTWLNHQEAYLLLNSVPRVRMLNRDTEKAFMFIFSLYFALSKILLLATDIAVFCSGESSQHKQVPCDGKLLIYVFSNLS